MMTRIQLYRPDMSGIQPENIYQKKNQAADNDILIEV
jgi:hypothetical protein